MRGRVDRQSRLVTLVDLGGGSGPGSQGQKQRQELRRHGAKAQALASRRAWLQRQIALAVVILGTTAPDSGTSELAAWYANNRGS